MNLPNKLKLEQGSKVWIWANDKLAVSIMAHFADDGIMAKEVCKRYNRYNKLVIALVVVSTLLVFAASTIVQLIRFKLV